MTGPGSLLASAAAACVLTGGCGGSASAFVACPSRSGGSYWQTAGASCGEPSSVSRAGGALPRHQQQQLSAWRCHRLNNVDARPNSMGGLGASVVPARRRSHGRSAAGGVVMGMARSVDGQEPTYEVVFVRHGQSTWNKANRFIGWTDAELTEEGEIEARVAGQILLSEGYEFDIVYTSMLKRAIKTAWVVLDELSQQHVPVITDWHLNERCYGALVGREKKECVRHFGAEQVKTWRRSYDIPPPPIDRSSKLWPGNNPRYNFLMKDGESQVPLHESLKDVMARSSTYWEDVIAPAIRAGKRVCVCGHENNLRSLLKHVDDISIEDIMHVELPRAVPLVYYLDNNLRPIPLAGAAPYLSGEYAGDPEEIAAIMERDFKNVYDLSVSQNLEESETRFAAKLEELAQPCSVDDFAAEAGLGGEGDFSGTFLETGVGESSCRDSGITSTPLLLYNRGQQKKPSKTQQGTQDNPPSRPSPLAPPSPEEPHAPPLNTGSGPNAETAPRSSAAAAAAQSDTESALLRRAGQ